MFSRSDLSDITYHEVDFPTICTKKLNTFKATPALRRLVSDPTVENNGSWQAHAENRSVLWCHGLDLRELVQQQAASRPLPGLRTDVPTLLISECCLCYLEPSDARDVIKWFADQIPNLGIVLYEPVKPHDAFGKTMVSNLASRGIAMPTLDEFKERADQEARLRAAGFAKVNQMTVDEIWNKWVLDEEKDRVNGLEGLDEVEEWNLLASHYIVAWGWRGEIFPHWIDL